MTARDWFTKAQNEGFAIGAFNVDNLDIFKAICEAGRRRKSAVMLEFSQGEVGYFGLANIVDLVENAQKEYEIPILLNLDHAKKVEDCLTAIEVSSNPHPRVFDDELRRIGEVEATSGLHPGGVSSVGFDVIHFDGSEFAFDENVEATKKVVEAARGPLGGREILVEGEIDRVSGSSELHNQDIDLETLKKSYTDPARAAKFVAETNVDIFAAVFGNVHGTFPNQPDLDFDLLSKIRQTLPDTFLSLHGGSGIPSEQVKEAIKAGKIVKINVNTEIRQAFADALGEELGEHLDESAYYKLTPDIVTAVMAVVEAKIEVFGSANRI